MFEDSHARIEEAIFSRVEFLQAHSMGEHVNDAQRILNEVAMARICLVDSKRKQEYDEQLRNPVEPVRSAKRIPMAIPIESDSDSKLPLVVRKTHSTRQQPKSKESRTRRTGTKRAWMAILIGAVVCLSTVAIGVYWWLAPSNQNLATENQIANESNFESVTPAVLNELEVKENQASSEMTKNKPMVKPASDVAGAIILRARDAQRHGIMAYEYNEARGFDNLGKWQSPQAYGQWDFQIKKPGTYNVELVYASPESPGYRVIMGSKTLQGDLENTSAWNSWTPVRVGKFKITDAGEHSIQLHRKSGGRYGRINVHAIRLIPAGN